MQLLTPTHPVAPGPRREKWEAAKPIRIGDNVGLGGGAIVLAGVTIGANTVLGAGAVVTRDLPAHVVAAGNPARVVRAIDETLNATLQRRTHAADRSTESGRGGLGCHGWSWLRQELVAVIVAACVRHDARC